MAVAALVLGILGTILSMTVLLWPAGVALGVVAVVLGRAARKEALASGQPAALATSGFVLGVLAVVLGVLLFTTCALMSGRSPNIPPAGAHFQHPGLS